MISDRKHWARYELRMKEITLICLFKIRPNHLHQPRILEHIDDALVMIREGIVEWKRVNGPFDYQEDINSRSLKH